MEATELSESSMPDAAMPDASLMASTMDDLFGDTHDLAAVLPPSPAPEMLLLRIAQLQTHGCCTKLAWSSTGSLATISPDGSFVTFRVVTQAGSRAERSSQNQAFATWRRENETKLWKQGRKNGSWRLSDEAPHVIQAPEGRKFLHVQFNGVGMDLAITDDLGELHIYTLSGPLGKMRPVNFEFLHERPAEIELNLIVGLHWLALFPAEFRGPYIAPTHKINDKWTAHLVHRDTEGHRAHHPVEGKNALLYVTRLSKLNLLYQNEGGVWNWTGITLDPISSSQQVVTHADIGEDGSDLLVTTHDQSGLLRVYRVAITWNASPVIRAPNVTSTVVGPSLGLTRLTAVQKIRAQGSESAILTHLRIVPAVWESLQAGTLVTIIAVFTQASLSTDDGQQAPFSAIARWHVESAVPSLHAGFDKLKSRSSSGAELGRVTRLKRQPDVIINRAILTFEPQTFDTMLAFAASDGSLDLRDRTTMDSIVSPYHDTATAANLAQSGFEYMSGDHNIHIALSANSSGMALTSPDGTISVQAMSFKYGWQSLNEEVSEAVAVCLAREYAMLCYNNVSSDEVLGLLPPDASLEIRSLIVKNIFKMISRSPDISMWDSQKQSMFVLREPLMPRALSAQLALGIEPGSGDRKFAAQFAYAVLNLRLIGTSLAQMFNSRQDQARPDSALVHSMRGLARWFIDLLIFIVNGLLTVQRAKQAGDDYRQLFEQRVRSHGDPALHLIFCSYTRALLRLQTIWIGKYFQTVQAAIPYCRSDKERQDLADTLSIVTKAPLRLSQFEQIVVQFDQVVRMAYTNNGISPERRADLEVDMMVDGIIPDELNAELDTLMNAILKTVAENVEQSRLFYHNTEWLQLANTLPSPGAKTYDVIRKTPLTSNAILRTCRRCGSVMEDIAYEKIKELSPWLQHAQRTCICMNYWIAT